MSESAIERLLNLELPSVSPRERHAFVDQVWDRAENADRDPKLVAAHAAMDDVDVVSRMIGNAAYAQEIRERAARAYYRTGAYITLLSNELCEDQKTWVIKWVKPKLQPERILAIWGESTDPHAPLVRELRALLPSATPVEIAKHIATVCHGWALRTPGDERDYSPSPKVVRRDMTALAGLRGVPEAVRRWLPTLDPQDHERAVMHAGPVLAADGSAESASVLEALLAGSDRWYSERPLVPRDWAIAIWSKLAPADSAVAALLTATAPKPAKAKATPKAKAKPTPKAKAAPARA